MGQICPECKTHQPQIQTFTRDLGPAFKAEDVVAVKLACGHKIGNKEFNEYQKVVTDVITKARAQIDTINENVNSQIAAEWEKMKAKRGK